MKRILVALFLVIGFSAAVFAKEFKAKACTADKIEASLKLDIKDNTPDDVKDEIEDAFKYAAQALSFQELIGDEGFYNFVGGLTPNALEYLNIVDGPPVKTGTCK